MKLLKRAPSRSQLIILGFVLVIMCGTLLLMLPIATADGEKTTFINALLTATSATCVTGLIAYDTFVHWTLFGQLVILCMIQIGGLGLITFGVYGMLIFGKKLGLKNRELIRDSLSLISLGGSDILIKRVIRGTFLIEAIGAAVLSLRFIPDFGIVKGIYFGIFHSVSAFCNGGFDVMGGEFGEFSSLSGYVGDFTVNSVIMLLIIIGGLGFTVWEDLRRNKLNFKRYSLHTKLVLSVTAFLILFGAAFFFFSERNGAFARLSVGERLLASFFASVSPRTAGFNTTDIGAFSDVGKAVTMILMFIGGSPGSTAGGIKTTTLAAVFFFILSYIKREKGSNVYGRRIDDDLIKKASAVIFINLSLALTALIIIVANQSLPFIDAAFEVFSAIGTAGITTGITRDLTLISRLAVIFLMFCGRVGSLSFALSLSDGRKIPDMRYPTEDILIG